MTGKPSPNFRTLLKSIGNEEILVPQIRNALADPSFKDFNVNVEGFTTRPPNGWFWPSTHPTWPDRLLYEYLINSERLLLEPFDPSGTLAVTAGSFFHTFIQTVLVREGILVQQPVVCGCGHKHPERAEIYLVDEESGTRGHSDGATYEGSGWEFKTMTPMKLDRMPRGTPTDSAVQEWFRVKCADYFAQAQEYLRMSGRERMIVTILSLTYPFNMREVHVAYDRKAAFETRDKYLRVREAAARRLDGFPAPRCAHLPTNKECPARGLCWR